MSQAITLREPLTYKKITEEEGLTIYTCSGYPTDCIKMALNHILDKKPDYILSGINHGSNASVSVLYSGTMAVAIEGTLSLIPSIGFSGLDFSENANFDSAEKFIPQILTKFLKNSLPLETCLNINIPSIPPSEIKGIKICHQTKGRWKEILDKRTHPHGKEYYWLVGDFDNFEPDNEDSDVWAVKNQYIAIVPIKVDLTNYQEINYLKKSWDL